MTFVVLDLNFLNFLGAPMILKIAKSVFLAVNASLRWLLIFVIPANHKWDDIMLLLAHLKIVAI